jgi:hypothetical protein
MTRYTHVFSRKWDPLVFMGIGVIAYFLHEQELPKEKRLWNLYQETQSKNNGPLKNNES